MSRLLTPFLFLFSFLMALFEDPLTADLPSRLEREEEEAEAVLGASGLGEAPLMLVRKNEERVCRSEREKKKRRGAPRPPFHHLHTHILQSPQFSPSARAALPSITALVVATSPIACALVRSALRGSGCDTLAGAAVLPEISLAGNSAGACPPPPGDAGCFLFLVGGATLVALAQFPRGLLPDGRAPALAKALAGAVPGAAALVALASTPAHALAGPAGAAAVERSGRAGAALSLETPQFTAAVPGGAPPGPPPLPPGAAVTGLAAALVSLAAAAGRSGAVALGVDTSSGAPPAAGLVDIAGGMAAVLARAGGVGRELVEGVKGGAGEAAAELAAADAAAARSAVYF